jgi:hypothetical protein
LIKAALDFQSDRSNRNRELAIAPMLEQLNEQQEFVSANAG